MKYAILTNYSMSNTVFLINSDVPMPRNKNAAIRKFKKWIDQNPGKYAELVQCHDKKGDITLMKSNG